MPLYEYQCADCLKTFEVHLSIDEQEKGVIPQCEHCGSKNVRQLLGSTTVITSKKS
jgi:putative FmdB family regulatory protein